MGIDGGQTHALGRAPVDPEVSVVIPTRDRCTLLALALETVLDQRGVRFEVIVVNDGSTDDTADMVTRLGDPRVRLITQDAPRGVSAARNLGIAESRGEWIAFLDDDDLWAPDKLRIQLQDLRQSGRIWSYTGAVNITLDHRIIGGAPPPTPQEVVEGLPRTNLVPGGCSSQVVLAKALKKVGGFEEGQRYFEDWDLWNRLARAGPPTWIRRPLVAYRVHSGNATLDIRGMLVVLDVIENRYGGPIDRVVFYRHLARMSLRMNRQGAALGYYVRAAARGPARYGASAFFADVAEVLVAAIDRVQTRLGHRRWMPALRQRSDPHRAWKEEARTWIEDFARRRPAVDPVPGQLRRD